MRVVLVPGAEARIEVEVERLRDRLLHEIAEDARRYAPVETGALRDSIHVDGNRVVAGGGDVDYAVYQELGTRYMHAHPFLRPATFQYRT